MEKQKYVIFHVEGGLGKNVVATSLTKNINKKYPDRKLIVLASFPEIFLNNPFIYRVYNVGLIPYFYDDYIKNKDTIILKQDPYSETSHILKKSSLIETWHTMFQLPYDKDKDLPELYMNLVQNSFHNMWKRNKPILVLHTNGGPLNKTDINYSWTRDMPFPIIQNIIEQFSEQYHIIQICKTENQKINHPLVEPVFQYFSNYELFSLLQVSAKRVLIDSCLQHAAAAFRLPSSVIWVGTSPNVFGYKMHDNIVANSPNENVKHPNSYYFDYQLDGIFHECPYQSFDEMFDISEVLNRVIRF